MASFSTPSRLGQSNLGGDALALFLKVFAGEVLTAAERMAVAVPRVQHRSIASGKEAQFPVMGRTGASLHTPGAEIDPAAIPHAEKTIGIDGLLISPVFIANIDEAMNHYDVRSEYARVAGEALAILQDKLVLQIGVLTARASATLTGGTDSPPGGLSDINANYKTDATTLAGGLFKAAQTFDENWIPDTERCCFVKPAQYYLLAQNLVAINRDYGGSGAYSDGTIVKIAGIEIVKTNTLPTTNLTGQIASKYNVDASNTAALILHRSAVGSLTLLDMAVESEYSVRHQGTLLVAKMAKGNGTLRPEAAVELKTA